MPLIQSGSKKAIGMNIQKEKAAGKPHKQAVAVALNVARKNGGPVGVKKGKKVGVKKKVTGGR